jgi:hypothetical protein
MNRSLALGIVAFVLAGSTGCSIIDRLFLLNADGPYGHHAHGHGGPCGPACRGGACEDGGCPDGGCESGMCGPGGHGPCEDGTCHAGGGHHYGGLSKHHLSAAERAALAASEYGAVTPAGPPSGTVAYPYYTTRGPRDFLAKRPPSIGP